MLYCSCCGSEFWSLLTFASGSHKVVITVPTRALVSAEPTLERVASYREKILLSQRQRSPGELDQEDRHLHSSSEHSGGTVASIITTRKKQVTTPPMGKVKKWPWHAVQDPFLPVRQHPFKITSSVALVNIFTAKIHLEVASQTAGIRKRGNTWKNER